MGRPASLGTTRRIHGSRGGRARRGGWGPSIQCAFRYGHLPYATSRLHLNRAAGGKATVWLLVGSHTRLVSRDEEKKKEGFLARRIGKSAADAADDGLGMTVLRELELQDRLKPAWRRSTASPCLRIRELHLRGKAR